MIKEFVFYSTAFYLHFPEQTKNSVFCFITPSINQTGLLRQFYEVYEPKAESINDLFKFLWSTPKKTTLVERYKRIPLNSHFTILFTYFSISDNCCFVRASSAIRRNINFVENFSWYFRTIISSKTF